MDRNSFQSNSRCNCQITPLRNSFMVNKTAVGPQFKRSEPLVQPLSLRNLRYERMKTTYQHDFGQLHKRFLRIRRNPISNDFDNLSMGSFDSIECRTTPKLPYLHGHKIPGKKRQKILYSGINNNNAWQHINVVHLNDKRKSYSFRDHKIHSLPVQTIMDDDDRSYLIVEKNSSDNSSDNSRYINIQESTENELTKSVSDKVHDGLNPKNVDKTIKKHRSISGNSPINKQTGDIIENFLVSPWVSEYQDTICGTAEKIYKIQSYLHNRHKLMNNYRAH